MWWVPGLEKDSQMLTQIKFFVQDNTLLLTMEKKTWKTNTAAVLLQPP